MWTHAHAWPQFVCVTLSDANIECARQQMQRLIESMDNMSLDAFVYPGWGNPPRLIGDLAQAGNTPLGAHFSTLHAYCKTH